MDINKVLNFGYFEKYHRTIIRTRKKCIKSEFWMMIQSYAQSYRIRCKQEFGYSKHLGDNTIKESGLEYQPISKKYIFLVLKKDMFRMSPTDYDYRVDVSENNIHHRTTKCRK